MHKNLLGTIGEDVVATYAEKKRGYKILGRNVRLHTGEIDIVAKEKNTIIFIEVKAGLIPMSLKNSSGRPTTRRFRGNSEELRPEQHVDSRKSQKLRTVCREYLLANRYPEATDWRIDVAAVVVDEDGHALIRYYPNAIGE